MKKIGLLVILLAILFPPLHAEENNAIYNTLMTNYIAMCWAVAISLLVLVTVAKGYILYRNLQEWR